MLPAPRWEEVAQGTALPPLTKIATTQMLVRFAGATGDFNPAHYEQHFAQTQGQEHVIVHGQLKRAWLCQLMVNWLGGDPSALKRLTCRYRAVDHPRLMKSLLEPQDGETWTCRGVVVEKWEQDGQRLVRCDIWIENGKGEKTTTGTAVAALPLDSSPDG